MKKVILTSLVLVIVLTAQAQRLTETERSLVMSGGKTDIFRVLQITNAEDAKILKGVSTDVNLKDETLPLLLDRMLATVQGTENTGVGIAAPQIGINKNVILVQRFDKPGEPFEAYLNPKIKWRSSLLRKGTEGCLSIADINGEVLRSYTIQLTYYDKEGKHHEEIIEGFTAVIFQHETDHLMGILFTDRLEKQSNEEYTLINGEVNLYLEHRLKRQ
ncbi:peptide deformylase [Flavobacterium sp. NRK1]|uniref:peptide deformylase n=1 Tax=Flavobacterium sp. NRK1 TaxID=2954929 RepID=UPI002092A0FB|nr:peptide deformylase [Flavobacterium sp. NRK1]MCO6146522.1 peptide deformylase [Flavobacterium sp. NRK1]